MSLETKKVKSNTQGYLPESIYAREIAERLLQHLDPMILEPENIVVLGHKDSQLDESIQALYPNAILHHVNDLAFDTASVDLIIMNLTLLYCDSYEKLIKEIARVTKHEGLLLFSSLGPGSFSELGSNEFVDMHNTGDLLVKNNFIDPVMESEQLYFQYDNSEVLQKDLNELGVVIEPCDADEVGVEIVYGHAWRSQIPYGVQAALEGVAEIPVEALLQGNRFK